METSRVGSLVRELETTLDLVENLMRELRQIEGSTSDPRIQELVAALSGRHDLDELPKLLLTAYTEVTAALGGIRLSREAIQSQAIDQLKATNEKLAQVSSHTEAAAMKMLDGLDRTLVLIDQLSDSGSSGSHLQESVEVLRSEINELFNCLQFQDITAQQLRGAVDILADVEDRLEGVANMFEGSDEEESHTPDEQSVEDCGTYDPAASMDSAASRQLLADEMVQNARGHAEGSSDPTENCVGFPQ